MARVYMSTIQCGHMCKSQCIFLCQLLYRGHHSFIVSQCSLAAVRRRQCARLRTCLAPPHNSSLNTFSHCSPPPRSVLNVALEYELNVKSESETGEVGMVIACRAAQLPPFFFALDGPLLCSTEQTERKNTYGDFSD